MAAPAQAMVTRAPRESERARPAAAPIGSETAAARRLFAVAGPGAPLAPAVRIPLEKSYGTKFDDVRVHAGGEVAATVEAAGARALTHGTDIYLGPGESATDLTLLGHEAAHVVQQRTGPALQPLARSGTGGALEREAQAAGRAAAAGQRFDVAGRTGGRGLQAANGDKSLLQRGADWLGDVASGVLDFTEDIGWRLADQFVPELVPILRKGPQGVIDWVRERVTAGVQALFDTLMAPVRVVSGIGQQLSAEFAPLVAWARDAVAKIARNDCSPFREAAEKIEDVAQRLIQPIVEKLQPIVAKVEQFFKDVWNKIGAPIWQWIKDVAGDVWQKITELASWVWDKAEPIRKVASTAWTWFKNKLGIGEGPEGQNGILQWVQAKLESAWSLVKEKLAPFQRELTAAAAVIGGIVVMCSPAGPIIALGAIIYEVVQGVRWIKTNWGKGDAVVRARAYLEKTLIPALLGSVHRMTAAMVRMANGVAGAVQQLANRMGAMVGAIAGSALAFAVAAVQWIATQINAIAEWASQKLLQLVDLVQSALSSVAAFMQKVLNFLIKVANVVIDIWSLPVALLGKVWDAIPSCVRDPFIDFIIPIILRQIEIFRELVADNAAWQKTKAQVSHLLHLVFVDRDLMGAVKATFQLILRVFNVPVDLAVRVWAKAQAAWDVVSAKPLEFIKNAARSIGKGFSLLWANIRSHLAFGLEGWLLGAIEDKDIRLPQQWSDPKQVFDFVVSVLGLSMNHVFDLLKKRFDPRKVDTLRSFYRLASKVVDWIRTAIDTSKSPAENTKGIIKQAAEFAGTIIAGIVEWIAGKVATELSILATTAAATGGLSEVVDALRRVYKAIQTAVRWARQILQMAERALDSVLEIAGGNIAAAGKRFEDVMHMGMPVVIGFLADQVGLGGVGQAIRDVVDTLRASVDTAILWLIDKIKSVLDAIVAAVGSVVRAVLDWWRVAVDFVTPSGERHTLKFRGEAASAELVIASNPITLRDFIAGKRADPKADQKAIAALDTGLANVDALKLVADAAATALQAQAGTSDKSAAQKKFDDATRDIERAMNQMTPHILKLLGSGEFGTEKNPIPIDYPKRGAGAYPVIYLGPKCADERIPQSELKAGNVTAIRTHLSAKETSDWDKANDPIRSYLPTTLQSLPDNSAQIGLSAAYQIDVGMVRQYSPGKTQGGGLINRTLAPYGYRAQGESMDGDHVVEMQIGGPNDLPNLWPLAMGENRSSGSLLKDRVDAAKDLIKKQNPTSAIVTTNDFWVIIRSIRV